MGSQGVTRAVWSRLQTLHCTASSPPLNTHCADPLGKALNSLTFSSSWGKIVESVELRQFSKPKLGTGGESKFKFTLLSFYALNIPRNHARGASQIGTVSSSHILKFFELLDASLSMPLAIITLGSRTDLPGGRFVTRWCARRLPMLSVQLEGAVASHLKDASTKRFSAAALCVFLLQLCKYFFHSFVSISAASHCRYFPLICDSDFAR